MKLFTIIQHSSVALLLGFATQTDCLAQTEANKTSDDSTLSFNLGATSDYRYRGISQSRLEAAVQGGADFNLPATGYYAGTWISTITWIRDTPKAGATPMEWDLYAGRKISLNDDASLDLGSLAYVYLNNRLDTIGLRNANTLEIYAQVNYGSHYFKLSHAVSNLFGIVDSKRSNYLDIGSNLEVAPRWTINLHAGKQFVNGVNRQLASYQDYKIGITKDVGDGLNVSLAVISTNANPNFYSSPANTKNLGKRGLVASLVKAF
ncbi:TorF family putative porin [Undibacterium cyanobacteriorum]|uniref:TorF family putative porin n=1 Tax=Undibacterium cyanobacteriorum TaxID=3073561 RepID=A0ABY9RKY6_9BURK|nr:TorF family putative porin [Undibacterium sp. 20NA77.5]WMW81869.1 TorF family putative porin [Undibacterium sp. 20NA77.5]